MPRSYRDSNVIDLGESLTIEIFENSPNKSNVDLWLRTMPWKLEVRKAIGWLTRMIFTQESPWSFFRNRDSRTCLRPAESEFVGVRPRIYIFTLSPR